MKKLLIAAAALGLAAWGAHAYTERGILEQARREAAALAGAPSVEILTASVQRFGSIKNTPGWLVCGAAVGPQGVFQFHTYGEGARAGSMSICGRGTLRETADYWLAQVGLYRNNDPYLQSMK